MISVALIGGDGAGKTTIARMLQASSGLPIRYMYMGFSMQSTNMALPTSRLAETLKGSQAREAKPGEPFRRKRLTLWSVLRLGNRIAEEWYRQLCSYVHRRRGQIVLYD